MSILSLENFSEWFLCEHQIRGFNGFYLDAWASDLCLGK